MSHASLSSTVRAVGPHAAAAFGLLLASMLFVSAMPASAQEAMETEGTVRNQTDATGVRLVLPARTPLATLPAKSPTFTLTTRVEAARPAAPVRQSSGRRSVGRIVAGAAVGAVGGFFAGGFLGAAIEGDRCECDDPGLQGFLIGAPVGATVGGILGGKYLF